MSRLTGLPNDHLELQKQDLTLRRNTRRFSL